MPFKIFHKKKELQHEKSSVAPPEEGKPEVQEEPIEEVSTESASKIEPSTTQGHPQETTQKTPEIASEPEQLPQPEVAQDSTRETSAEKSEKPNSNQPKSEGSSKTYLKAMPLKDLSDVASVESEVRNGNIIILRVTPLAGKSIEDVKTAVNELFQFVESVGGDIARLGEERVVICPKTVRIWREKTPAPVASSQPLPTTA